MISESLKTYLHTQGVGTFGTDLFVSVLPDTPDNALCLYDEASPVLPEMSSYDANNFGCMVQVRGSYSYCKAKIIELLRKVPMLSGEYESIRIIDTHIQSFPQFVEVDDKGRRHYTVHFTFYCNIGTNDFRTGQYTP